MLKLDSLDDLGGFIDVCRAKGVTEVTVDGVTMKLAPIPEPVVKVREEDKVEEIDFLPLPRMKRGKPEAGDWEKHVAEFERGIG